MGKIKAYGWGLIFTLLVMAAFVFQWSVVEFVLWCFK